MAGKKAEISIFGVLVYFTNNYVGDGQINLLLKEGMTYFMKSFYDLIRIQFALAQLSHQCVLSYNQSR